MNASCVVKLPSCPRLTTSTKPGSGLFEDSVFPYLPAFWVHGSCTQVPFPMYTFQLTPALPSR